jgi:transcriptional regulator with PAS, ATPase and Fis domain
MGAMTESKAKKARYYTVSLNVIIPLIVAGLAALAAIMAFRLTEYYIRNNLDISRPIVYGVIGLSGVAFAIAYIVIRLIMKPVETFVNEAKRSPVLSTTTIESLENERKHSDQLQHYARVFQTVTNVLSRVEARRFFPEITGESRSMRGVLSQILKVAPSDSTVLIMGESGTGKELVAASIHEHSQRNAKTLVAINCAAIPPELLESELFGHEKGAFSGATARKLGKFEVANGGSIFLDEIGDMPLGLQAKLLRVIQEKQVDRVGGTRPIQVDLRFIAATNKNLAGMVEEGSFREDLYYRLNVVTLELPPLRDRKEDIPLLVDVFLQNAANNQTKISTTALQMLMGYSWPGNIRELENTIESAALMCSADTIEVSDLPPHIAKGVSQADMKTSTDGSGDAGPLSLDDHLKEIEIGIIMDALRKAEGVQVTAAELLGINVRSLWHRIKKYDIDVDQFKRATNIRR